MIVPSQQLTRHFTEGRPTTHIAGFEKLRTVMIPFSSRKRSTDMSVKCHDVRELRPNDLLDPSDGVVTLAYKQGRLVDSST